MTKSLSRLSCFAPCLWGVCLSSLFLAGVCSSAAESPLDDIVLVKNQHVCLALDKGTGAIQWIEDKSLNQRYDLRGTALVLTIDGSQISSPHVGRFEQTDEGVKIAISRSAPYIGEWRARHSFGLEQKSRCFVEEPVVWQGKQHAGGLGFPDVPYRS